ncbi:uncharacterized protein LOC116339201 [Contarinia nasturtii]|uniref:uncharacterized protein LOC116339201 n=1 Tax=Contarinia nasturtii TaxID=265458 RepID=UPI0012D47FDF|nr:uncharacterized protein LOC116339201 [Contarinia nasturtii]
MENMLVAPEATSDFDLTKTKVLIDILKDHNTFDHVKAMEMCEWYKKNESNTYPFENDLHLDESPNNPLLIKNHLLRLLGDHCSGRDSRIYYVLKQKQMRVIYNIGARKTLYAGFHLYNSPKVEDDTLKTVERINAIRLLQESAGIFEYVKSNSPSTSKWTEYDLQGLTDLMLAQAQELHVLKAVEEGVNPKETASLAFACKELYSNSLKTLNRSNEFILLGSHSACFRKVTAKEAELGLVAEYYQSLFCQENGDIAEEMVRLQKASDYFKTSSLLLDYPLSIKHLRRHQFAIKLGSSINKRLLRLERLKQTPKASELDEPEKNRLVEIIPFNGFKKIVDQFFPKSLTKSSTSVEDYVETSSMLMDPVNLDLKRPFHFDYGSPVLKCGTPSFTFGCPVIKCGSLSFTFGSSVNERLSHLESLKHTPKASEIDEPEKNRLVETVPFNGIKKLDDQFLPKSHTKSTTSAEDYVDKMINIELKKLRKANEFLLENPILEFPRGIYVYTDKNFPETLLSKARDMHQKGGFEELLRKLNASSDVLKQIEDMWINCDYMLNEENKDDLRLRELFKEKWTLVPFNEQTQIFRTNAGKLREFINKAKQVDKNAHKLFNEHSSGIEGIELQMARVAYGYLKNRFSHEEFLSNQTECDELFNKELNWLRREIEENQENQNYRITWSKQHRKDILKTFMRSDQSAENTISNDVTSNEVIINGLTKAYDSFVILWNDLNEADEFYKKLTIQLTNFEKDVSDTCLKRQSEKNELLHFLG